VSRPAKPEAQAIGRRLAEALDGAGIGNNELARDVGVASATVVRWRKGESEPSYAMLLYICKRTGTSADEILGLKDLKRPDPPVDSRKVEVLLRAVDQLERAARDVEATRRRR
jgi:transcriptional regulator with XRE-family HTH domain